MPEVDREKHQAAFVIYVDPGRRVYIRKINISGNARTRDEIIRREMRQLESAWYDGARIERSKVRIRRLGYFEDVNIETPPVAGTTDQADVDVTVTEKATGSLQAGVGYSSADGLVLSASVAQQNIFGTGNALTAAINTSKVNRTTSPCLLCLVLTTCIPTSSRFDAISFNISDIAFGDLGHRGYFSSLAACHGMPIWPATIWSACFISL